MCYHFGPEWTREQWQWRGAPHSPKLQRHWNFTIRLSSVINRTLIGEVLTLSRGTVSVFCCSCRLGKRERESERERERVRERKKETRERERERERPCITTCQKKFFEQHKNVPCMQCRHKITPGSFTCRWNQSVYSFLLSVFIVFQFNFLIPLIFSFSRPPEINR